MNERKKIVVDKKVDFDTKMLNSVLCEGFEVERTGSNEFIIKEGGAEFVRGDYDYIFECVCLLNSGYQKGLQKGLEK